MLDPLLEAEVVKELGDGRRPEELLPMVCQRSGLKWDEAKECVAGIQSRSTAAIGRRKRRINIALGIPTAAIGLVFAACGLYGIIVRDYVLIGTNLPSIRAFAYFGIGTAMVVGGLVGIFKRP